MNANNFKVGDLIRITTRDLASQKLQKTPFEGIVISLRGQDQNKTFTVRKNASAGIAVERIFPLDSPLIDKIIVIKKGDVRRAKLYYLRKRK